MCNSPLYITVCLIYSNINLTCDSYMTQLRMTAILNETRVSWCVCLSRSVIVAYV